MDAVVTMLIFVGPPTVAYLWLSLTDRRSLSVRVLQCLAAAVLVPALGMFFHDTQGRSILQPNRTRDRPADSPTPVEWAVGTEAAVQLAGRAVGGWLALLGIGELLRVGLKRRAGVELLEPAAIVLAGVLLFSPHWSVGTALAAVLLGVVALHIWERQVPSPPPAGP